MKTKRNQSCRAVNCSMLSERRIYGNKERFFCKAWHRGIDNPDLAGFNCEAKSPKFEFGKFAEPAVAVGI